jgi:hypothetical protein
MLSWKVSTDPRVAALSCDSARLLYTWMIAHADNLGRLHGEPEHVRASILPHQRATTAKQVGTWLGEMAHIGLIYWYDVDGLRYIQLAGWDKHQQLRGNMKRTSDLPEPCERRANVVHTACERRAADVCSEGKGEGEVEVEGEVEGESASDVRKAARHARSLPTLDEVKVYCSERVASGRPQVDPEAWFDHYSANGWKVGKNPMRDWRAAVRTWEKNGFSEPVAAVDPNWIATTGVKHGAR